MFGRWVSFSSNNPQNWWQKDTWLRGKEENWTFMIFNQDLKHKLCIRSFVCLHSTEFWQLMALWSPKSKLFSSWLLSYRTDWKNFLSRGSPLAYSWRHGIVPNDSKWLSISALNLKKIYLKSYLFLDIVCSTCDTTQDNLLKTSFFILWELNFYFWDTNYKSTQKLSAEAGQNKIQNEEGNIIPKL